MITLTQTFGSQKELEEYMEQFELGKEAREILRILRDELRNEVKHGPFRSAEDLYDRLWQIAHEQGMDLWEV